MTDRASTGTAAGAEGDTGAGGEAGPVDATRLREYLAQQLPGGAEEVAVTGFAASGSSNITAFLEVDGARFVLRRPPVGELLPTAHDVIREYRFVHALEGSAVPVPATVLACTDPAVLGAPFYIAHRVDGAVLQEQIPAGYADPDHVATLSCHVVDALAALHDVGWQQMDLPYRPGPYLQRQISRWSRQLELTDTAPRLAGMLAATRWLKSRCPADSEQAIVHGDYGLHNMIVGMPPDTRVRAVLDWELATVGDPLADLAWFLSTWGPGGGARNPANAISSRAGAPPAGELLERYAHVRDRAVSNWLFYEAFSLWKRAVMTEGLYSQYVNGTAANPAVVRFRKDVPEQVEKLRELIGV